MYEINKNIKSFGFEFTDCKIEEIRDKKEMHYYEMCHYFVDALEYMESEVVIGDDVRFKLEQLKSKFFDGIIRIPELYIDLFVFFLSQEVLQLVKDNIGNCEKFKRLSDCMCFSFGVQKTTS